MSVRHDMTLTELRHARPDLFYRQDWFLRERFMQCYPTGETSVRVGTRGAIPTSADGLPRAVDLAHLYVADPTHAMWRFYWWCADTDAKGQRVYVGGVCAANGLKFEIHRHLHITDQWVTAL